MLKTSIVPFAAVEYASDTIESSEYLRLTIRRDTRTGALVTPLERSISNQNRLWRLDALR